MNILGTVAGIVLLTILAIVAIAAFLMYVTWKEEKKCDLEILLKEEEKCE